MTLQLTINQCMQTDVERLSDYLEEQGALSVTLTDKFDTPILEPQLGTTPLWADVVIQALFEDEQEAQVLMTQLQRDFPHLLMKIEDLPQQDWERVCMVNFKPQRFGRRLWICPSWSTPPDPDAVNLTLDPGLAFGTGTHPTTALCLTWLEQTDWVGKQLIDYGCGSGILALAALKLGAQHVAAVDLDEQALIATRSNAQLNGFTESSLQVSFPAALHEPVDVLIANILLSPLLALKGVFRELLKPKGRLVVSGLLKEQERKLIEDYADIFAHQATTIDGDWCLVEFYPAWLKTSAFRAGM